MSTEIYYFSGTGNSLFIARELQKRIPDSRLIPIVGLLHHGRVQTKGKMVGFVFPVHALTIPIVVKKFIRAADFGSSDYLFAVATRVGTVFRGFEKMERLLKVKKRQLGAGFILNMPGNDVRHKGYKVPSEADILALEETALEQLGVIAGRIVSRTASREEDTAQTIPNLGFATEKLVLAGMAVSELIGGVNYFFADSKCIGCGTCERICLSHKIRMKDEKPVWQKNVLCYMCFACLNFCPAQAVQIKDIPGVKSYTGENGRYPHPYAATADIAAQKQ